MSNSFRSKRDDGEKHATRWYSNKQETEVAKAVGGKKQPNSGATMFLPGDLTTDKFAIECKTCMKDQKSFTLKEEWFEKNKDESLLNGKDYTALVFNFGPGKENHYVIDEMLFNELLKHLNEN